MLRPNWSSLKPARLLQALVALTFVFGLITVAGTFVYAPADAIQGDVQRIFYIHAPMALCAYLGGAVVAVAGLLYLITRQMFWDRIARSAAEIAVLFTSLVLITGSLWGKPVWGTWWAWDARLTTTLILWFIYAGYLMLRSYIGDPERAARYSVLVGLLGAVDIPIVHVSVEWWRTLHPQGIIDSATGSPALPGSMLAVFAAGTITMICLFLMLLAMRVWLESFRDRVAALELSQLIAAEDAGSALISGPTGVGPAQAAQRM